MKSLYLFKIGTIAAIEWACGRKNKSEKLLFKAAQSTIFIRNIKSCDSCEKQESSRPEKSLKRNPGIIDHKTFNHQFNIFQGPR